MQTGTDDPSDPANERVRRGLDRLRHDEASAPDVPAEVTARITAALRAAGEPAHAVERPRLRRLHLVALAVGLAAAVAGVVIGTSMLSSDPAPRFSDTGPTADRITVSRPSPTVPLSGPQLIGLLSVPPDYGPLADPERRAACLAGLGHPAATPVLGARPVDMGGRAAVLLILPADAESEALAVVVDAGCHAAHSGLLAETVVRRP
ncbi:hypothetical protein DQP55_23815 [Mycolicibacterium sp. GF69]|uniref:hypothetical protein n=1 Tax=Mycolicibacterium sp. GF69 TaxID=2267251 RepID=UPI000DCE124B|nr:hypothetical protein [Mycolicibacterium sp. GF69]RAV06749.1 hypothetical protein DQP55_23815 [Mycolicibacterium sp. GF69]